MNTIKTLRALVTSVIASARQTWADDWFQTCLRRGPVSFRTTRGSYEKGRIPERFLFRVNLGAGAGYRYGLGSIWIGRTRNVTTNYMVPGKDYGRPVRLVVVPGSLAYFHPAPARTPYAPRLTVGWSTMSSAVPYCGEPDKSVAGLRAGLRLLTRPTA